MTPRPTPNLTRDAILDAAFEEIHRNGFRGASLDNILARTGVTKGALYHHFPNKNALGYAVVDEVIVPWAEERWAALQDENADPIEALMSVGVQDISRGYKADPVHGCPINNLVQEMAGLDDGFRKRLTAIVDTWRQTITSALRRGQARGEIRADIDADEVAAFLIASYQGAVGMAKCMCDEEVLHTCFRGLRHYLETLRAAPGRTPAVA